MSTHQILGQAKCRRCDGTMNTKIAMTVPPCEAEGSGGEHDWEADRSIRGDGQQHGYVALSDDELASAGFACPLRYTYVHNKCGISTTMSRPLAETYARNPEFYSGTFLRWMPSPLSGGSGR